MAAAANNLAELLRLRKLYDEAAPLYEQVGFRGYESGCVWLKSWSEPYSYYKP